MRPEEKGQGLGSAVILPEDPVVAGEPAAWDIVYTCGEKGISEGGGIRIEIPYGFSPPQISYSSEIGFTTVECSKPDVSIQVSQSDPVTGAPNQGTFGVFIYVLVEKGKLEAGDTLTVHYGRGEGGGLTNVGAYARYFEGRAEFTVLVDRDGSRSAPRGGFYLLDGPQPTVEILGGQATHLLIVLPSIAGEGQDLPVRITARDANGNTAPSFHGEVVLAPRETIESAGEFEMEDSTGEGKIRSEHVSSASPFRLKATCHENGITGLSNPSLLAHRDDPERVYWGDLHVMTGISAGIGRPAEALEYARDMSHLDFCAVTDGDHADGYFTDEEWEETKAAVREAYDPGRFVTILASEYHERRVAGDKNIYYRTDDAPLLRWSDLSGDQPEALWEALEGKKAMTVPHHTVSGSSGLRPWEHHHPEFQRLVEIYSIWGNSECDGCTRPNYWVNNFDNSVQQGLAKGYRTGIIASGDSHDGLAGNSSWMRVRRGWRNGLVAVRAAELTRGAVFDALWNRRCYGTSGERIILSFSINGSPMGSELSLDSDRAGRSLRVRAAGTAPISRIVVVRNSRNVFVYRGSGEDELFTWMDEEDFGKISLTGFDGKKFLYYYVRVEQADGELAWSSPIWVS
jgi:hypothetical protein